MTWIEKRLLPKRKLSLSLPKKAKKKTKSTVENDHSIENKYDDEEIAPTQPIAPADID